MKVVTKIITVVMLLIQHKSYVIYVPLKIQKDISNTMYSYVLYLEILFGFIRKGIVFEFKKINNNETKSHHKA